MIDRLDRLRHDAVVGRDHQDHEVGHLGAARAHRGEGGVAGRIDEGDLAALRRGHLIGADMLGDAAGFAARPRWSARIASSSEVLPWSTWPMMVTTGGRGSSVAGIVGGVEQAFLDVGLGDAAHRVAELLGDQLRGVGVDRIGDLRHLALLHQDLDHVDARARPCGWRVPGS